MNGEVATSLPNTLGVPSIAERVITVTSEEALVDARRALKRDAQSARILGDGSNVVLPPRVSEAVLLPRFRGIRERPSSSGVLWEVGAGESWHELVRRSVGAGLTGLQCLALIPGTVGAAPIQNIGAYGAELSDVLESVRAYDLNLGRWLELSNAECRFGYRDSVFKANPHWFVTHVRLQLSRTRSCPLPSYPELQRELKAWHPGRLHARSIMEAVVRVRRRKLPAPSGVPNVGSFFKNPVLGKGEAERFAAQWPGAPRYAAPDGGTKVSAAWLIEQCGWKPRRFDRRQALSMWFRQPLVLTNPGRCQQSEVLAFADSISESVSDRFAITLHVEPEIWR